MDEQIIEFETAVLAKEVGFDWQVYHCYKVSENILYEYNSICDNNSDLIHQISGNSKYAVLNGKDYNSSKYYDFINFISAPTQSLLQKWLREVHNIHITLSYDYVNTYRYKINDIKDDKIKYITEDCKECYENALEEALQESLNYIKNKKRKNSQIIV